MSRRFEDGHTGLENVSLTVSQGDFVAVVGQSGAGKSTLLNILGLLDRPTEGAYLIGGIDVSKVSERRRDSLRSKVFGFVFQSAFVLGDESVVDNAALGLRIQGVPFVRRTARARFALARVGLRGYDNAVAKNLSGGERQRLAMARAIATRPLVILADEPTGNLDTENGRIAIGLLQRLNADGATIVLVTHDDAIASHASRRIRVADGSVWESQQLPKAAMTERRGETPELGSSGGRRRPRLAEDFNDAMAAMGGQVRRAALLVLAFALGVGGLIGASGIGESASAQVASRLTQAALDGVRVGLPGGAALLRAGNDDLDRWMEAIGALPFVEEVGYVAQIGAESARVGRLNSGDVDAGNLQVISASASYLRMQSTSTLTDRRLDFLDDQALTGIAVLGDGARSELDLPRAGSGTSLWVAERLVQVVDDLPGGREAAGLDQTVVVSRDVLAGSPSVVVFMVVRTSPGFPASVAEAIPTALDPVNPGRFVVETVADLRSLRQEVNEDLGVFIALLSGVLLLVASISAAATMYLSVRSRAPEIALRRSLGAGRFDIGRMFLVEGFLVGILGGAVGALLGTALSIIGASMQGWAPVFPTALIPLGIGLGASTGLLSSIIPALAASRQEPSIAIRG